MLLLARVVSPFIVPLCAASDRIGDHNEYKFESQAYTKVHCILSEICNIYFLASITVETQNIWLIVPYHAIPIFLNQTRFGNCPKCRILQIHSLLVACNNHPGITKTMNQQKDYGRLILIEYGIKHKKLPLQNVLSSI